MNFLKKTATNTSIEAKYLEGKARGFKHPGEVTEQLEIHKQQIAEIKKLKKYVAGMYKEEKSMCDIEEKAAKVFTDESTADNQNPKAASVYRMYADCRSQIGSNRGAYVNTLQSILQDWKELSKTGLGRLEKNLDVANKSLVTRQYYEGNRDYIPAKQWDEKYSTQIVEWVGMLHDLRKHKEELHPQLILRTLQASLSMHKQNLTQFEMCETAIRNLGPVEAIKFPGFYMEARQYAGVEDSKINHQNPYASDINKPTGYASQPTGYGSQPALPPQPVVPSLPPQLRARALYAFAGTGNPGELPFNAGDVLTVVSQDGAWWTAELNGARGFVPSNYVQLC